MGGERERPENYANPEVTIPSRPRSRPLGLVVVCMGLGSRDQGFRMIARQNVPPPAAMAPFKAAGYVNCQKSFAPQPTRLPSDLRMKLNRHHEPMATMS